MMKRHNILTVLAVLLLTFAACDKNSAPGFSFTTDSILTLTFDKELDTAFVESQCKDPKLQSGGNAAFGRYSFHCQPCRRF